MQESDQYVPSIVTDDEIFRLKAKRDWDNSINTAYEIGYELGVAETVIERLSKNKVESNPKLLCIVLDSLFSLNVTTEKIAKHTGLPENLIDDACEMNYNYKHSTSSNIFGHTNRMEEKELQEYEDILKHYRDLRNSLYTAENKGRAQ